MTISYSTNSAVGTGMDIAALEKYPRPYSAEDVIKLRGSVNPECTFAQNGAKNCGNCCTAGRVKGISTVWGINRWSGATTGESRC